MGSLPAAAALAWACAARWLMVRLVLAVVAGGVPVAIAWLTKVVLDRVVRPDAALLGPVLALAGVGLAAVVLPPVTRYAEVELERAVGLGARERLFAAVGRMAGLRRLEHPGFQDRLALAAETGSTGPAELVGNLLAAVQGLLTLAGFLVTLALLNPWLLAVVVFAAIPTLRAELWLGRHRARMMSELGQAFRRETFYAQLMTSVVAAKEMRLYGLGGLFGARMVAELSRIHASHRRMDRRELLTQSVYGLLGAAVAGAGLVWAVNAARSGRLSVGDVSVFVAAVAGVQGGLSLIIGSAGTIHEALLLFGHYRHVVEAGPDLAPPPTVKRVPRLRHGIEVRDVWFRYRDDLPWALRGVDLTLPAGAATALVGRNGAGKSTLVKLLCRFYDPDRGSIRWDGIDLRDLPVDELRRHIGAVFQDFMQYELSAADNIAVGDIDSLGERDRIVAAARQSGCHETLAALPRGYDTMLTRIFADPTGTSPGVVLSGGQWQRVALARALLRGDRDLLILDEPSSGLDAEAEHDMASRLRQHRATRTSLLISHRLNAVRDADAVVVLGSGAVVERGTHTDLLDASGLYARLFRLQATGYR